MAPDYLTFNIAYNLKTDSFEFGGTMNDEGRKSVLEVFLMEQVGKGKDLSEPIRREVYHINFKLDPSFDDIVVSSDTGNKGLRDGILMKALRELHNSWEDI